MKHDNNSLAQLHTFRCLQEEWEEKNNRNIFIAWYSFLVRREGNITIYVTVECVAGLKFKKRTLLNEILETSWVHSVNKEIKVSGITAFLYSFNLNFPCHLTLFLFGDVNVSSKALPNVYSSQIINNAAVLDLCSAQFTL